MLPKVATHILHHTSRAAAAVQNQTSQAIRNAWQYQQGTPSVSAGGSGGIGQWGGVGSSSGWGGSSAGPGGAKYNAGSRFYSGYTGPGRSVTQANSTSTHPDDNDERPVHPVRITPASAPMRTRPRSNSLSLSGQGRIDRGEHLGVLQVVQMRARHAFAAHRSIALAIDPPSSTDGADRPVLVRRNSTSTQPIGLNTSANMPSPSPPLPPASLSASDLTSGEPSINLDITDPAKPQSVTEPLSPDDSVAYERIRNASHIRDYPKLIEEIEQYRARTRVSVPCYNIAMQALYDNRTVGQPILMTLSLYNEMLERNLIPNLRTYKIMILTLCARDTDVQRVISSLENRISRRSYTARTGASAVDEQRIAQLRTENNFTSALSLFQAATVIRNQPLGLPEYNALLRSCGLHRNVDAAVRVFSHLEKFPNELPSPVTYALLLSVFCDARDLVGAQQVFSDFKEASRRERIAWNWSPKLQYNPPLERSTERNELSRHSQIQVWNKMIETYFKCGDPAAALDLFEIMLDTPRGINFLETDAPLPNSITYTSIITAFCETGDVQSALKWFDRLLAQDAIAENPYAPISIAPRPDQTAWIVMIDTLARAGKVDDLNRIFTKLLEVMSVDKLHVRTIDRFSVFRANFDAIQSPDIDPARADEHLDFVLTKVMDFDTITDTTVQTTPARQMLIEVVQTLVARHESAKALDLTERYVHREHHLISQYEANGTLNGSQTMYQQKGLRGLVQTLSAILLKREESVSSVPTLPLKSALRLAALAGLVNLGFPKAISAWYIHSYMESKRVGHPFELTLRDWELLLRAFAAFEMPALDPEHAEAMTESNSHPTGFVYPGLKSLLGDIAKTDIQLREGNQGVIRRVTKALVFTHGRDESAAILRALGSRFTFMLELRGIEGGSPGTGLQEGESIPVQETHTGGVHVDLYHSRFVEEWYPANPSVSVQTCYERFQSGIQQGVYPSPECIGRLIGGLGRLGDVEKVRILYHAAQRVLAALGDQKRWQSAGWFVVEDQMTIAFAHAGDYGSAQVHRERILEQGGTPSADAYGALIAALRDTTDDTAHALQLWEEALERQVRPNIFMYNTIISKLAKARKADHALAIFQYMKEQGVKPSSVTYGALIAACSRVGDAQSAEYFFNEMSTAPNFKPRVPPYNTMIQLYTYVKPDRERVLHYYNALLQTGIKPTAHTYKLLLDAYGTIDPVNTESMEDIFQQISLNPNVEVQGTHWAAMINAYGCAGKDLNRAIGIFESIEKHPSTTRARTSLPDAVTYEALFTVFAAHRRSDLIRVYLQRLRTSHIHPTAYVSNAVIKGYTAAGDLESARAIFESMEDPPMGVAAPNNHSLHNSQRSSPDATTHTQVYREPSTWETMVRAELGVSERERALDLIRRMDSRGYPPAVVQRVRDIMHSDSLGERSDSSSSLSPISS